MIGTATTTITTDHSNPQSDTSPPSSISSTSQINQVEMNLSDISKNDSVIPSNNGDGIVAGSTGNVDGKNVDIGVENSGVKASGAPLVANSPKRRRILNQLDNFLHSPSDETRNNSDDSFEVGGADGTSPARRLRSRESANDSTNETATAERPSNFKLIIDVKNLRARSEEIKERKETFIVSFKYRKSPSVSQEVTDNSIPLQPDRTLVQSISEKGNTATSQNIADSQATIVSNGDNNNTEGNSSPSELEPDYFVTASDITPPRSEPQAQYHPNQQQKEQVPRIDASSHVPQFQQVPQFGNILPQQVLNTQAQTHPHLQQQQNIPPQMFPYQPVRKTFSTPSTNKNISVPQRAPPTPLPNQRINMTLNNQFRAFQHHPLQVTPPNSAFMSNWIPYRTPDMNGDAIGGPFYEMQNAIYNNNLASYPPLQHLNQQPLPPPPTPPPPMSISREVTDNFDNSSSNSSSSSITHDFKPKIEEDEDDDEDLIESMMILSLIDPISGRRMKTPVKSRFCSHLECFDMQSFMTMNSLKPFNIFKKDISQGFKAKELDVTNIKEEELQKCLRLSLLSDVNRPKIDYQKFNKKVEDFDYKKQLKINKERKTHNNPLEYFKCPICRIEFSIHRPGDLYIVEELRKIIMFLETNSIKSNKIEVHNDGNWKIFRELEKEKEIKVKSENHELVELNDTSSDDEGGEEDNYYVDNNNKRIENLLNLDDLEDDNNDTEDFIISDLDEEIERVLRDTEGIEDLISEREKEYEINSRNKAESLITRGTIRPNGGSSQTSTLPVHPFFAANTRKKKKDSNNNNNNNGSIFRDIGRINANEYLNQVAPSHAHAHNHSHLHSHSHSHGHSHSHSHSHGHHSHGHNYAHRVHTHNGLLYHNPKPRDDFVFFEGTGEEDDPIALD